ncbi:MAG TPA: tetratricopeptide repeat protein [Polyangia bacterium]|nr:tetratricopeptide repeat protein [Polyangia bacterium]
MKTQTVKRVATVSLALLSACAGKTRTDTAVGPPPVEHIEMDPIKISAVKGPDGVHMETFDVAELFEHAGKALAEKRYDDAIAGYEMLLREFPGDNKYRLPSYYNEGLAYQGKKDWAKAVDAFKKMAEVAPNSPDTKDALFQLGATYAEMGNWPTSATIFAQLLERKDMNADDKIEAYARRGFAQFQLKDLDTAERTFSTALYYFRSIEKEERLQTDFYLGLVKYHLAQIPHERFRAVPLRLPEKQMAKDLDDKARLLLTAQRQYIDTIKMGNPQWASASGYQVGSLYEELYDSFIHAPIPAELMGEGNQEKREVYYDELRKKIRILLEKSLHTHEENLLMLERLGVQNEWRDKSKLAFAKLQKMLDPSFKFDFADPATAGNPEPAPPAPPTPTPPAARPGNPEEGESGVRDPKPPAAPPSGSNRQIL